MDSTVLEGILNEPDTQVETKPAVETLADIQVEEKPAKASTAPDSVDDPDLKWDEDEVTEDKEPEDKAPDQQDDAELAAIEEKNKWMKGRLAPVKEKLSKAEQELAALRAENEALKSGKPAQSQPEVQNQAQDLDAFVNSQPAVVALQAKLKELDEKADNLTEKEYIDQKLELLSDLKIEKREIANAVKQYHNQQHQQLAQVEAKIVDDYTSVVMAKKEEYPDIDKALDRINKNAQNLDTEIRRSLVFEGDAINPLAGELVNIIGNDKKAMGYLIAQSKLAKQTGRIPTQAIEYIGRLKARIQSEKNASSMEAPDVEETVTAAKQRKPGVPKEVRSHSASEPVDLQAWAQESIKAGKRPW